ncbi:MAG: type II secretion system protein GspM [Gemmobacter sp.]
MPDKVLSLPVWISDRTPRERLMLGLMAGSLVIWAGYAAVWQPINDRRVALNERIDRYDQALALLQSGPAVPVRDVPTVSRPVATILTESAATFGLSILRLEPEGTGARLVLQETPFQAVIEWINALESQNALRLTLLELTRRPAPGVVTATLSVQR